MRLHRHPLRRDNPAIYLDAYLLHASEQYFVGQPRPAVIVCPGGGYQFLSDREAEPIALRFLAHGYHAFVLRYSVNTLFPAPMVDLAAAIQLVRRHAEEWLVEPHRLAVCGFSAGGHLAASLSVLWDQPFICDPVGAAPADIRPDAVILGYPVIDLRNAPPAPPGGESSYADMVAAVFGDRHPAEDAFEQYALDRHVTPQTSPAFIWHTATDAIVPVSNALRFASALAAQGVNHELHIFDTGPHGLALANHVTATDSSLDAPDVRIWVDLALNWLGRLAARS